MSLVVKRAAGLCTVQDLGRRGHMHEAVPPGGALVGELLVAANRAVGNQDDAPAIEVLGQLIVRATADILIATDRIVPRMLRTNDELVIASEPLRCTYVAIAGGIAAPRVLDGHGTLLCAGLGAPLRASDTLMPGDRTATGSRALAPFSASDVVHVIAGPDLDAFESDALDRLTSAPYRILPSSDRVGTRLAGATLSRAPSYREQSRPMVQGALEVPRDGQPIVLGPEHPTTGGYPIVAVIANAELGRFHAIRLGGSVRFALVTSSR
jgi:5-oxoprolinase (ATP-hydrolysing) subunit C